MATDPNMSSGDAPKLPKDPPPLPPVELPVHNRPETTNGTPPPLPTSPRKASPLREFLAIVLSLCLGLFLADALVSLLDDSLILFFRLHLLSGARVTLGLFTMLLTLVIYGLMGLTPLIPKRVFLPLTLFTPLALLGMALLWIYFYHRIEQVAWLMSFAQLIVGLGILSWIQGGFKLKWRLISEKHLGSRPFSWLNLGLFLLVNALVVLPGVVVYLLLCARLAVDHFSEGFLALRTDGITVQVRKYVRNDGKVVQLVPMSHIGEPDFYRKLSQSFPSNAVILMEGVTDNQNLLTNKITYKRAAKSLGLTEQHQEFTPAKGEWVRADVDVEEFAPATIDFLNLVTLVHVNGMNARTLVPLMRYSPPADFQEQLLDDLLTKRNQHVSEEIKLHLAESDLLIVPWGAAHMPGIAKQIRKCGFRLAETQEYTAIRFRSGRKRNRSIPP